MAEKNGWQARICSLFALLIAACSHTQPGTYVELVDKDGTHVYVAGAAAPGVNKSIACTGAVGRSVAAIGQKFADENEDVAEDIAKAVGTEDGKAFLHRYAKDEALNAAVQDVTFDPAQHLCMATVRWRPPLFVKDAVLKFAEQIKQAELGQTPAAATANTATAATPSQAPTAPVAAPPAPAAPIPPPAPVSVAPPPAAPAGPSVPACSSAKKQLTNVLKSSQKALDDLAECKRRTQNDATICHRYQLYVDEAQGKEQNAANALATCINAALSSGQRQALQENLPGYAALAMETKPDGALLLWTFSAKDSTAYAVELPASGGLQNKAPLAANQVQWLRQQLGL